MTRLDAFLLAGGRSSRMGRDKAALAIGGVTFLEAVARAVAPLARSVTVVGREAGALRGVADPHAGLRAAADLRPGLGPLAGVETALSLAETDRAFVLACDLPLISTALLELIAARAEAAPGAAVVPEDAGGRLAPLCAVYPAAARDAVSALLDAGERRPRALFDRIPTRYVPFDEYRHLPRAGDLLRNVNTPEEYEALRPDSRGSV